ncbi:MAG TPA: hypothetical protein VMN36_11505 [Verrucomicrobiales bacterium]|nr:hypothetical protein [Verrucomicrobiales bacterium]
MPFPLRHRLIALAVLVIFLPLWLFFVRWTPSAEVKRHQKAFFRAIESADWDDLNALLDPSYRDDWDLNGDQFVRLVEEGRAQFLYLDIEAQNPAIDAKSAPAEYRAVLRITGSGHALTQQAQKRFNRLQSPFVFSWRKSGPKPWDWQLVSISNPGVNLSDFSAGADLLDF